MQPDLSIIIVSWNVWDLLRACLLSIEQISRPSSPNDSQRAFGPVTLGAKAPTLEVIVVDNASADATAALLPARFPWVRLVRCATNLGFTAGNNVGYATSRGQAVYFLNPDTELVETPTQAGNPDSKVVEVRPEGESSLWTLYRALMDNPSVGLVGPQLRYPNNCLQSSRRRFPTRLSSFFGSEALGRYWHNNPWQRRLEMDEWPATFRQETDWLVGAAMLARRRALEEIRQPAMSGPFDEGFFMYSEETDLCKRLKAAGWRIVYVPDVVVIHYEGQSSSQVLAARDLHFQRSNIRYHEKYFGPRWAEVLRVFLLWNLRGQIWLESAKWLLGHKRELRAARVQAYRQVLATRLRSEQKTDSVQPVQ